MLSPHEFKEKYLLMPASDKYLISYTDDELSKSNIKAETKYFLKESGLPNSVQPRLEFNPKLYFPDLTNVKDFYQLNHHHFEDFWIIGGGDNVDICIDSSNNDQILICDFHHFYDIDEEDTLDYHEDYMPIKFMNSSINQLAEFLLLFHEFSNRGELMSDRNQLLLKMEKIDIAALNEKCFWQIALIKK